MLRIKDINPLLYALLHDYVAPEFTIGCFETTLFHFEIAKSPLQMNVPYKKVVATELHSLPSHVLDSSSSRLPLERRYGHCGGRRIDPTQ